MAKISLKQFMKDSKKEGISNSEFLNLKETGKLIVWLHPESGIETRKVSYLPTVKEVEVKKGKKKVKEKQISGQMIILGDKYEECPLRQFTKALREDDSLSDDDVILEVGEGKSKVEILKGDIIGTEGYDWKRRVRTMNEYLFGAINHEDVDAGVQVLIAPKSLGKAITKVIENQMEEADEEEGDASLGDPFENPYAFKLTYDEDEQPSLMYSASYHKAKVNSAIKDVLSDDGIDLSMFTKATPNNVVCDILEACLVAEIEGFDIDDFRTEEEEDEKPKKTKTKAKAKKKVEEEIEEEDDEIEEEDDDEIEEEEEEEEEVKPKKSKAKAKAKAKPKTKAKKKVEEEEEEDEEEEEEEVKPKKSKAKAKGKAKKNPQVPCPACGEMVDEDATECPECGAEFDEESIIICPECGAENDEDAEVCVKCETELVPFA